MEKKVYKKVKFMKQKEYFLNLLNKYKCYLVDILHLYVDANDDVRSSTIQSQIGYLQIFVSYLTCMTNKEAKQFLQLNENVLASMGVYDFEQKSNNTNIPKPDLDLWNNQIKRIGKSGFKQFQDMNWIAVEPGGEIWLCSEQPTCVQKKRQQTWLWEDGGTWISYGKFDDYDGHPRCFSKSTILYE